LFDASGPAEQAFLAEGDSNRKESLQTLRQEIVKEFGSLSAGETGPLTSRAEKIFENVVSRTERKWRSRSERIDRVLLHPVAGPIVLVAIMTLMFQSIFSWAEPLMNGIDALFGSLAGQVELMMAEGPLRSLLVDGVIGGVGSVLIFLPQIIILFLYIAILEDSGYMPRAAFLVDRLFGWCGLSGKSFIPMLSSFACAIPGIMATRTIEDRKLRLITIIVSPLMSCSARLPVYTIMIAAFIPQISYAGVFNSQGLVLTSLYLMGIAVAVIVSFILNRTILKTERGSFLMEMPSYKLPTLKSVVIRVLGRARSFVVRAGTVIFAITVIIWALSYYPRSESILADFDQQIAALESEHQNELAQLDGQIEELTTSPDAPTDNIARLEAQKESAAAKFESAELALANQAAGENLRNSYFGRAGRLIEPIFQPLGWDWRITMATLASFPAREVIIATLGTIFNLGGEVDEESSSLVGKMRGAVWQDGPRMGEPLFTPAVALSIMVFFALCCQCGATLVTIRQETGNWKYAVGTFAYMTALAYVSAFVIFQAFSGMGL
jgi:ferrous iron transport protein B